METFLTLIAIILLLLGTALSAVGVLGFVRLPDVYTRLHATGKVSVFGLVFLLLAAGLTDTSELPQALMLIIFVLIASPGVSHAISSAAYKAGIPMTGKRDELKGKLRRGNPRDA